jgi:hypothetical protein
LAGETEVIGENCPSAALSTTNPTCCPDANPGRRGRKPATNRLSYGTAYLVNVTSQRPGVPPPKKEIIKLSRLVWLFKEDSLNPH